MLLIAAPSLPPALPARMEVAVHRPSLETGTAAVCDRTAGARAAALIALQVRHDAERELPLLAGAESRLVVHEPPTGKGTAVLLHGWTAATNQYDELAPVLFEAGYDVWVPRLPGHGLKHPATGQPDSSQLPRAGEAHRFTAFADEVYGLATRLGGPVHLVGLSGGAAVALDVAERHPDVGRVVAMAPFLNVPGRAETVVPHVVDFFDTVLLGPSISTLDLVPFAWEREPGDEAVVGYREFRLGNVTGLRRFGYQVGERLGTIRTPTQYITSAVDRAASDRQIRLVFAQGAPARQGWYQFPVADDVPHAMIAPARNHNAANRQRIIAMVRDFLDTGRPVGAGPVPAGP